MSFTEEEIINAYLCIKIEDAQASLVDAGRSTTAELHQKYDEHLTEMNKLINQINQLFVASQQIQTLKPLLSYVHHWQSVSKELANNLRLMGRLLNLDEKSLFTNTISVPRIQMPDKSEAENMEKDDELDRECLNIAGLAKNITENLEKAVTAVNNSLDELLDGGSDAIPKRHLSVDEDSDNEIE